MCICICIYTYIDRQNKGRNEPSFVLAFSTVLLVAGTLCLLLALIRVGEGCVPVITVRRRRRWARRPAVPVMCVCQPAYVSIRQHTSAYV